MYRSESAFCFLPRTFGRESLSDELLHAKLEVQCDFRVDITSRHIAPPQHQVEEPANAGADERHRQRAGVDRMPLTVSAYRSH